MKQQRLWLVYSLVTMVAWGLWGAWIDIPANNNFPETLGYVVWALTMIPPALVALNIVGWKVEHDRKSIFLGCAAGFLGAGGQLLLFKTLRMAPAYLVFPFIALSPLVTIVMAVVISKERAPLRGWAGIVLALIAGVLLSYSEPTKEKSSNALWIALALLVLLAWGIQGYAIFHANKSMKAEGIFFYMALTSILLIPVALYMTDFNKTINWGFKGPGLAALIQLLNAVGALLLVYAFRYGKAIIVAPLVNAAPPVITIIVSLLMYGKNPGWVCGIGMVLAVLATLLMTWEEEKKPA